MLRFEQLQREIELLPEEAQTLLMDFIEILKKRYHQPNLESSPYQAFKDSGFIGCVSIEEDLSTTYKHVLAEEWKVQPKSVGIRESVYSDLSERVDKLLWRESS